MNIQQLQSIAKGTALNVGVDPILVQCVCEHESSWDPLAWNPEPRYRYMWDVRQNKPFRQLTDVEISSSIPPADFHALAGDPDQEWWGQRASWGLMQVMGAVARERGFTGPYLTAMTDPLEGLIRGCRHLKWCLDREGGDLKLALLRFNGGGAANYPDLVLQFYPKFKGAA